MQISLCKQALLLTISLLLLAGQKAVAQKPNTSQVTAKLSLIRAEGYWNPTVDQSELIRKERAAHPESGDGHGGWYVKVEFPGHPSSPEEFIVEFSFHIEKDPFHPKHPTDGKQPIVVNWGHLEPLSFQVTKNGSVNYAVGEGTENLEKTTRLVRRRMSWQPFEIFVPWELFHLYELFDTPEKQAMDGFRVAVYIKADVYRNARRIGGSRNVPIVYHIHEVPKIGVESIDLGTDDISSLFDEPEPSTTPRLPREGTSGIAGVSANVAFVNPGDDDGIDDRETNGEPGFPPTIEDTIPSQPPRSPHIHSYVTSVSFGTPQEVKAMKPVKFDFPKQMVMNNGGNDYKFKKIDSDLGDNIYFGQFLIDVTTLADAERCIAHLNDSLAHAGAGVSLRLPTKKEASQITGVPYEGGDDDLEPFFEPTTDSLLLALEYKKDRNGIVVVPDHVTVTETRTLQCACGEIQTIIQQCQFRNMVQCRSYINRNKK